jgi:hypothetical protein
MIFLCKILLWQIDFQILEKIRRMNEFKEI